MGFLWVMQTKHNMDNKWNEFQITPSKKFGYEVPIFQPSVFREYRGEIFTTYHSEEHPVMNYIHYDKQELSIHGRFSRSYKGVLRGLHWDKKTWKLVQAAVGDIYLVVLDMRESSHTFGDWESFIITERLRNQVLIPPGFANGHYALTDCMFHYNLFYKGGYVDTDEQYVVKWNDSEYQIEWPNNFPTLQNRDK
jgi:dTDP-4-dehydrorhamnose 3,5-epimerase